MIFRHSKAGGRDQFVVRIEGRSVATGTALVREDLFAAAGERANWGSVRRWLEGVKIQCQGVELFVAVPTADVDGIRRIRQRLERRNPSRDKSIKIRQVVTPLIQSGIAHQINDRVLRLKASSIKVTPVLYANQIRHLNRIE